MAILSNVPTDYGVGATYFKIRDISINHEKYLVAFSVYGYTSIEARQNKENAIYIKPYEVSYEEIGYTTKENIFDVLWDYIKKIEMFKGYANLNEDNE